MQYLKTRNSSFRKWKRLTGKEDLKDDSEPFMCFFYWVWVSPNSLIPRKRKKAGRIFFLSQIIMKMEYFFPKIFSAWSTIRICLKKQPSGNDLGLNLVHKKMRRCCGSAWGAHSLCSHIFLMKTRFVVQVEKCVQNGTRHLPSQPAPPPELPVLVNGITTLHTTQAQNLVIFAPLSLLPLHPDHLSVVTSAFLFSLRSLCSSVPMAAAQGSLPLVWLQQKLPSGFSASLKSAVPVGLICLKHRFHHVLTQLTTFQWLLSSLQNQVHIQGVAFATQFLITPSMLPTLQLNQRAFHSLTHSFIQ